MKILLGFLSTAIMFSAASAMADTAPCDADFAQNPVINMISSVGKSMGSSMGAVITGVKLGTSTKKSDNKTSYQVFYSYTMTWTYDSVQHISNLVGVATLDDKCQITDDLEGSVK